MIIALWIIAVCEVIRIVQNGMQLHAVRGKYEKACDEFVKSLHQTDADFYKGLIKIVGRTDIKEDSDE